MVIEVSKSKHIASLFFGKTLQVGSFFFANLKQTMGMKRNNSDY